MYYDIEEEARHREPDIDEELQKLEDCKALATQIYESSEKTKEDYEKYNYKLLAIADNKNRLLQKKLVKYEIENINLKSDVDYFRGFCRYSGAERLLLWLLCGFSTTLFFSAPNDIFDFIFQLLGSFIIAFPVALTNVLFPKHKGRYNIGDFYENHPFFYAIICFIIIAAIITVVKILK